MLLCNGTTSRVEHTGLPIYTHKFIDKKVTGVVPLVASCFGSWAAVGQAPRLVGYDDATSPPPHGQFWWRTAIQRT